jgi:hypothetical protein
MKKYMLKWKLFLSGFRKQNNKVEQGFIYEFDDKIFKNLSTEEQGVQVQKSWNRYMKND